MKIFSLFLMLLFMVGCTASYRIDNLSGTENSLHLDKREEIYISIPSDGAYGSKAYPGSGQTVAQAIAAAFSKYAVRVHIGASQSSNDEAINAAKQLNAKYVVMPVIAHWEHRATEWSGRPSRMTIRVMILDATTGEQLASTSIEGRSRIMSFTSTSPESLLRGPLSKYVNGLYN